MCSPSNNYNYPQQPSYGEGMADAMKAQMQMLTGTGDFADIYADAGLSGGNLGDILREVEAPIRQQTAQTDTDVLRQTLLGNQRQVQVTRDPETGRFGVPDSQLVMDENGEPQTAGGGRYQMVLVSDGKEPQFVSTKSGKTYYPGTTPKYALIDTETGGISSEVGGEYFLREGMDSLDSQFGIHALNLYHKSPSERDKIANATQQGISKDKSLLQISSEKAVGQLKKLQSKIDEAGGDVDDAAEAIAEEFTFKNPYTGEDLQEGEVINIRAGDGMIDLLGDRRNVQEFTTRQATQADVDAGLATEVGDSITEASGNRMAGFDESGNFLGLSALAEDIQRGNLSRQREADLADVERLSERFQNVMADYKPETAAALTDAGEVLASQKDTLTGAGAITVPGESTFGGNVEASTMTAAQVADPMKLSANTAFTGALSAGEGEDTLRNALLGDARTALDSGLTEREQAQIANAARARQTMMGRTFDQSGAIAEAEARVQEDNARRMQNRSFAQSVLGQEAGLQQGDITRGMAQESEQAGLQQQANLAQAQMDQQAAAFDADAALRTAMANQAQQQQANQFQVGAQMDAERLNEQLKQSGTLGYIDAATRLAALEDQQTLDPFAAILGRAGGGSLQAGQGVFGQAGYGLSSGPQYLNPEAGLGYISQMAANDASMYAANQAADATRTAGIFQGIGSAIGGFCWVAREVYGPTNPAWLQFREWMFTESPNWFFNLYKNYGERFASWISNKPRIKDFIRKWMDSKIKEL